MRLRLSAIGDVCHAISVVQAIRGSGLKAITWITGKIEAMLIGIYPVLRWLFFDKKQGFKGMRELWRQLSDRKIWCTSAYASRTQSQRAILGISEVQSRTQQKRTREMQSLFTNLAIYLFQTSFMWWITLPNLLATLVYPSISLNGISL